MKPLQNSTSDNRHLSVAAVAWAENAFADTSLTITHFAERLSARGDLSHIFKRPSLNMPLAEYERVAQANYKKMQRFLRYEALIPADILPAWADCLPNPYGDYLRQEINAAFFERDIYDVQINICIKALAGAIAALASGERCARLAALHDARECIDALLGGHDD